MLKVITEVLIYIHMHTSISVGARNREAPPRKILHLRKNITRPSFVRAGPDLLLFVHVQFYMFQVSVLVYFNGLAKVKVHMK